jgi:hypothetical protein
MMEAILTGLINRSTASGWLLCCIAMAGLIQLGRIVAGQRPKMRELDISEDAGIRAFMAEQMDGLRVEIKTLREENQSLRNEVRGLHGVIDGMRREALQAGISTQRAVVGSLPRDFVPEKTREALDRIEGTGE